jgi:signal transduction histidine kinase
MNAVSASQLVDGSLVLLPAVVQAGIAGQHRWTAGAAFPHRPIARWLPHPGVLMALSYALSAVLYRVVPAPDGSPRPLLTIVGFVSIDVLLILGLAGYVHLTHGSAGRWWLAGNYGSALALGLLAAIFPAVIPLPTFAQQVAVFRAVLLAYYMTSAGRILGDLVGPADGRPGKALFALGMVLAAGGWMLLESAHAPNLTAPLVAAIGLAFAAPFAGDRLGRVIPTLLALVAAVAGWRIASAGIGAMDAVAAGGGRLAGPPPLALAAAAISALQGLVWAICARRADRTRRRSEGFNATAGILAVSLMSCMAAFSAMNAICWLFVPAPLPIPPWLGATYFLHDWLLIAAAALAMHMARLLPSNLPAPTARWVWLNYFVAGIVGLASVLVLWTLPTVSLEERVRIYIALQNLYVIAALAFVASRVLQVVRAAKIRRPEQDILGAAPRWSDVLVFGLVVAGIAGGVTVTLINVAPGWEPTPLRVALTAITGTAALLPFAIRYLGGVVRALLGTFVVLALGLVTYLGIETVVRPLASVGLGRLGVGLAAGILALAFVPLQVWLRGVLERAIFRRSQRRHERLQSFLHGLPPELGTIECSRRAIAAFVEALDCTGAALLLDGGEYVSSGHLSTTALQRAWPPDSHTDVRPDRPLLGYELATLPLPFRDALAETGVSALLPLRSPRRYWGHLVVAAGVLATAFVDEDLQVAVAFADQLALILDTTELLERAVSVERSLAHAEKLAAVGETAARIAHDIRNPVTAARSLAQQLARVPVGGDDEAARLIVEELDRIERQVSALLRFVRREEFRFEAVDLGQLARAALEPFLPRLRAAGVEVDLDAPGGIVARADAERMRQALANLIENALAALQDTAGPRRLLIAVAGHDGVARLRVADSGPGVPPEALARLFEPFFTLKPTGTGLGLAIVKRTIDAHGGRVAARTAFDTGLGIDLELPLAREA